MENLTIQQKLQLRKLKDLNVTKVEISYSGGGDDGCIDDYTAYTINESGEEVYDNNIPLSSFADAFDDYIYNLLSEVVEWDWVNNEGGYGELEINIQEEKVEIHHTQRHTEDYHYHQDHHESLKNLSKKLNHGSSITP